MSADQITLAMSGLVLLEAGLAGYFFYQLFTFLPSLLSANRGQRKAEQWFRGDRQARSAFGSQEHKLAMVYLKLGLTVNHKEQQSLLFIRLAVGIFLSLMTMVLGINPILSIPLGMFAAWFLIWLIVDMLWKMAVDEMNQQIPGFISSLMSTLQVIPDVSSAVEEVCSIRPESDLLRQWMEDRLLSAAKSEGGLYAAYDRLIEDAFSISNALGVLIYVLHRYDSAGGGLWRSTLRMINANLNSYLQGVGKAKAISAASRNQMTLIGGIALTVMLILGRNQIGGDNLVLIRIVQFFAIGMMLLGWRVVQDIVNKALQ